MSGKIIRQLPIVREKNICPICGMVVTEHKSYTVAVTYPNHKTTFHECDLLCCANCGIPLTDDNIRRQIFDSMGAWINTFSPKENCSVASVRNQIYHRKKKSTPKTHPLEQKPPFELVNSSSSIWKLPKAICELSSEVFNCPKCNIRLVNDYTLIPVDNNMSAKISGRVCPVCKIIYVSNADKISKLMRDNPHSKGFTLNGRELWNATQKEKERQQKINERELLFARRKRLSEVAGAVVMICAKYKNKSLKEYIITNSKECHDGINIYHYASVEGRELLSAAYAKERNYEGSLHGCSFQVKKKIFADNNAVKSICPVMLEIHSGGGYYSSVKNKQYEIVDLLLYSPFSKRYEIIRATLDKEHGYCFSDISLFRQFVREYGNPGIDLSFDMSFSNEYKGFDLRSESVLKGYGYSVAEAEQLSTTERREILSEIIDLRILGIPKIISYLDFFCNTHSADKYYIARLRWNEDRRFVENYKANPNRFLIAQTKQRKDSM